VASECRSGRTVNVAEAGAARDNEPVVPQAPDTSSSLPNSPADSRPKPAEPLCLTLLMQDAEKTAEGAANLQRYLQSHADSSATKSSP
jgi:hypothetical protein